MTRCRGFTLIEMLVVLAIMALMVALVPLALWTTRERFALRDTAGLIATTLRETRSRALADGRTEAFVADLRARDYAILGDVRVHAVPAGIAMALLTTTDDRVDATRGLIRFFPDGGSSGGAVRLSDGRVRMDVRVDWFSGRVAIATFERGGEP